ncbi:DUF2304 domain-containing protein [Phycicoccus sp. Soil748]|uniref:DUF2304 domain-containing protein n=1 Tax=Phycicoccus sp. Soil748 TaxID=1736397 RepID=UPI0007035FFF|nr:DUF2304 domain-containing protein [Phycicoccus sp. Soil748]KRE57159.1 hypothetical protein ASG70_01650 [Phycicoccus sp. Soil748]
MNGDAYWLGVASGFVVVGVVIEMVRRRYLRGRFALVWILLGVGAILLALFPRLLERAATALGVTVPLNLLLFLGSIAMLIMIMQLSAEAGRLRERTRVLAEEVALLRTLVGSADEPRARSIAAEDRDQDSPR